MHDKSVFSQAKRRTKWEREPTILFRLDFFLLREEEGVKDSKVQNIEDGIGVGYNTCVAEALICVSTVSGRVRNLKVSSYLIPSHLGFCIWRLD